jgi:uncharacterized membrane protein YfcA
LSLILFTFLVLIIGYFAGIVGSLTGLGGGVVVIPALVLLFGLDIHYAMGASLISVVATSSGGAIAYLRDGYTNLRIGMLLEVAAVIGAVVGALVVAYLSANLISIIFGLVLIYSAYSVGRKQEVRLSTPTPDYWAAVLKLNGSWPAPEGEQNYYPQRIPAAFGIMGLAGMISGLLGIGAGTLKVVAMDQMMHLPYKVSTTTSNFLIGITAAVSAGVYFANGYIEPVIAFPVMLGVLAGAITGSRLLPKLPVRALRNFFAIVVVVLALQMIYKGIHGEL